MSHSFLQGGNENRSDLYSPNLVTLKNCAFLKFLTTISRADFRRTKSGSTLIAKEMGNGEECVKLSPGVGMLEAPAVA